MKINPKNKSSFVLIELILATFMAGLLLAVVFAVYYAAVSTVAVQDDWRIRHAPAAEAVALMARDLSCAAVPFGMTNPPFVAVGDGDAKPFRLSFYSAFPEVSSNNFGCYSLGHVTYTVRKDPRKGHLVLVRECVQFRAPARSQFASVRQEWKGFERMEVLFFDGNDWIDQWGEVGGTNQLPLGARINIVASQSGRKQVGTEVMINAARRMPVNKTE